MRSISEERRQHTDQLLYSLPLSMGKVVLGKYLAMLTVLLLPMALMCLYPLILSAFGTVNFASAYSGMIGFFLLGAALVALMLNQFGDNGTHVSLMAAAILAVIAACVSGLRITQPRSRA